MFDPVLLFPIGTSIVVIVVAIFTLFNVLGLPDLSVKDPIKKPENLPVIEKIKITFLDVRIFAGHKLTSILCLAFKVM